MITASFVTGSQVFGYATFDSDWDIVVRCEPGDIQEQLFSEDDICLEEQYPDIEISGVPIRHGKINYICCFTDELFKAWKDGTEAALSAGVKNREEAVAIIAPFRAALRSLAV